MNIEEYQKLTQDIQKLEAGIVKLKEAREVLLKASFEKDGKGHVYDVSGTAYVIQLTKARTHFLAPKDKWAKAKLDPKPKKEKVAKAPKEPKAPKEAAPKVDQKEVFRAALQASKANAVTPAAIAPTAIAPTVETTVRPVAVTAVLTAKGSVDEVKVTPVAVQAPVQQAPKELDPLEQALADLNN